MLIGYMRVSKADGSQTTDLQRDALLNAGVDAAHLYEDQASGRLDARPGLLAVLKALRTGDTLVVWKLDRLGRDLRHLINTVHDLTERGVGLKVLTGQGAAIDTTTPAGKLIFGIFAALAEFERELIAERTKAGLAAARAWSTRRRTLQDDDGQTAPGDGGDGATRDPHRRALPGAGYHPPDTVSSRRARWRASPRRQAALAGETRMRQVAGTGRHRLAPTWRPASSHALTQGVAHPEDDNKRSWNDLLVVTHRVRSPLGLPLWRPGARAGPIL
jgi:Resolvase, N terminal domain